MAITFNLNIQGLNKVQSMIVKAGQEFPKTPYRVCDRLARFTQKSAKLRAPKFTGHLSRNITIIALPYKKLEINVTTPYAYFQEFGYKSHIIPIFYMQMHSRRPAARGVKRKLKKGEGYATVSRFKPFITPALEAGLNNLPNYIREELNESTRRIK